MAPWIKPLPCKLEDQISDLQSICKCQLRVLACLDSQPLVGGDGVPRASQLAILTIIETASVWNVENN